MAVGAWGPSCLGVRRCHLVVGYCFSADFIEFFGLESNIHTSRIAVTSNSGIVASYPRVLTKFCAIANKLSGNSFASNGSRDSGASEFGSARTNFAHTRLTDGECSATGDQFTR